MKDNVRAEFPEMLLFLKQQQEDLLKFGRSPRRSCNLWRADLMRLRPEEVYDYLTNADLKLAEAGSLGKMLAERFFQPSESPETLSARQEALIYSCLELDVWFHWKSLDGTKVLHARREALAQKLKLWSEP